MQKDISQTNRQISCLSDEQILKLSKIGVAIEKLYGNARDIEWAIHEVWTIVLVTVFLGWIRLFYDNLWLIATFILWQRLFYGIVCFIATFVLWQRLFCYQFLFYGNFYFMSTCVLSQRLFLFVQLFYFHLLRYTFTFVMTKFRYLYSSKRSTFFNHVQLQLSIQLQIGNCYMNLTHQL